MNKEDVRQLIADVTGSLKEDIQLLKLENSLIKDNNQKLEATILKLEATNLKLEANNSSLNEQVVLLKQENFMQKNRINDLERKVNAIFEIKEKLKTEKEYCGMVIKEKVEENERLKDWNNNLNLKLYQVDQKIQEIHNSIIN